MGYPRAKTVIPGVAGFYHCSSKCVRGAALCGEDAATGRNYDHRRDWIEQRLLKLAETFAVGLYAWAVMSNHSHVVLRIDPQLPFSWSDEEVAARWVRLPRTRDAKQDPAALRSRELELLSQPERLNELRSRLGSVSWFMKSLNEYLARAANAEDERTGRFWDGRYHCQALVDDRGVLACMAYVDLNPIRAGLCDKLIDSRFTTIQRRLRSLEATGDTGNSRLGPVAGPGGDDGPDISLRGYIELIDWTGRIARPDKRGKIPDSEPPPFDAIRGSPRWWRTSALEIETAFGCVVGSPKCLRDFAKATGRRWLRGVLV